MQDQRLERSRRCCGWNQARHLGRLMQHEKIIKRDDGSQVRIRVDFYTSFGNQNRWRIEVSTKGKRKRNWKPVIANTWEYRKLPTLSERDEYVLQQKSAIPLPLPRSVGIKHPLPTNATSHANNLPCRSHKSSVLRHHTTTKAE